MNAAKETKQPPRCEVEELKARLAEAEETLEAIRSGGVDALLVTTKQGEQIFTLRGAEYSYRVFLETMSEGAVTTNAEGTILFCNGVFASFLCKPADQVLGTSFGQYIDVNPEEFSDFLAQSLERPTRAERVLICANRLMPVMISTNVLQLDSSRDVCIVVTDLTERKQAENKLREAYGQLEARVEERTRDLNLANNELESFSYSVAHDLRNPLKAMKGFVQIMREDCAQVLNDECNEYLRRIESTTDRMNSIVDDMLALSKISRQEMKISEVNLSEMARLTIGELQQAQPDRSVDIAIQDGLNAKADARLMSITLGNLLGNAWKYTKKKEGARIEFGAFAKDGQRIYYVKDNGAGFDMSKADKLFKPFQRLHSEKDFAGTGVGLAIVERAISRHGGKVWAESEFCKGATFYFTLGS